MHPRLREEALPAVQALISSGTGHRARERSIRSSAGPFHGLPGADGQAGSPGIEFVSLQYDECAHEIGALRKKHGVVLHQWPEAIEDYDETAVLVCALDQVVSVCTSLIHLAGALGRPAWVLVPAMPEWRYLREGNRMPWYPSVELLRQDRVGEWDPVIACAAGMLRA
jgi:hypothetical protein